MGYDIALTPDLKHGKLNAEGRYWSTKPKNQITAITDRLKRQKPVGLTFAKFCEFIKRGGSWCGGMWEPNANVKFGHSKFIGMQVFAVDIDNEDKGQNPLQPGDEGYLDPLDALQRAYDNDLPPVCLYFTFSAKPEHPKFRIVFAMENVLSTEEEAKRAVLWLMGHYPECDPACKNINRIFLGSQGEVWECYAQRHPFGRDEEVGN